MERKKKNINYVRINVFDGSKKRVIQEIIGHKKEKKRQYSLVNELNISPRYRREIKRVVRTNDLARDIYSHIKEREPVFAKDMYIVVDSFRKVLSELGKIYRIKKDKQMLDECKNNLSKTLTEYISLIKRKNSVRILPKESFIKKIILLNEEYLNYVKVM